MVKKLSKSIENKCSHFAILLIGKPAHQKEILDMFEFSQKKKMNAIYRNKEVYPKSDEPFRCINIHHRKASVSLSCINSHMHIEKTYASRAIEMTLKSIFT